MGQPKAAVSGAKGSPRAVSSLSAAVSARSLRAARIRAPCTAVDEQLWLPESLLQECSRVALHALLGTQQRIGGWRAWQGSRCFRGSRARSLLVRCWWLSASQTGLALRGRRARARRPVGRCRRSRGWRNRSIIAAPSTRQVGISQCELQGRRRDRRAPRLRSRKSKPNVGRRPARGVRLGLRFT